MPTASWQTGQTSAAAGGAGFGTGAYTTTNSSYSPTASRRVVVLVGGLTNNASDFTPGATPVTTSVGSGSNPTLNQHPAGWLTQTGTGWRPFCTAYYFDTDGSPPTNLRFICDATDSIYQWFVQTVEYTGHDTTNFWGRWGSDLGTSEPDSQSTDLDQNTGLSIGANSHIVKILSMDCSAGAIAPGTGYTERYEGPSGSGQTGYHVSDDQTSVASPSVGGTVTPTIASGGWVTFAFEVRDAADGSTNATATPTSVLMSALVGTATITTTATVTPTSVLAACLVGSPTVTTPTTVTTTSVTALALVGTPTVTWTGTVVSTAVSMLALVGTAVVTTTGTAVTTSVLMEALVGTPTIDTSTNQTATPTTVTAEALVGSATILASGLVAPTTVAMLALVGTPTVTTPTTVTPTSVLLAASVGSPTLTYTGTVVTTSVLIQMIIGTPVIDDGSGTPVASTLTAGPHRRMRLGR
jgi:hypothetical protein